MNFLNTKVANNCSSGNCSNCGECCTDFIPLTKTDVKRIKDYLKAHPEIKEQVFVEGDDIHLLCAFRDVTNKCCTIYPARPFVCRQFRCCQSASLMSRHKDINHTNAYFNHIDIKDFKMSNLVSTHMLFFNNSNWELSVLYALADHNDDNFKKLLDICYAHYKEEK